MNFPFLFVTLLSTLAFATPNWSEVTYSGSSYFIYVPQKTTARRSLMINLHGCAQKAQDLVTEGNWPGAAEKYNMVVVIPQVPGGGVVMGCWDYYGTNHTSENRHNGFLIHLIEDLIKSPQLDIDPDKVFISGLSSGGGEAQVIGCLRPDLIRGLGLNSSPVIGSQMSEISGPQISAHESAEACKTLAQGKAQWLARQTVSILVSDKDNIVSTKHSELIAAANCELTQCRSSKKMDHGQGIRETQYADSQGLRVSHLIETDLGHNWAAGPLPNTPSSRWGMFGNSNYISHTSMVYPLFLGELFSKIRR